MRACARSADEALESLSGVLPGPRTTRWGPRGGAGLVTSPPIPLARTHFRFEKCRDEAGMAKGVRPAAYVCCRRRAGGHPETRRRARQGDALRPHVERASGGTPTAPDTPLEDWMSFGAGGLLADGPRGGSHPRWLIQKRVQRGARDVCACARVRGRRRGDKRRIGDGPEGGVRESREQGRRRRKRRILAAVHVVARLREERGDEREEVRERQQERQSAACRLRFLSRRPLLFLALSSHVRAESLVSRLSKVKGITCGLFQARSIAHDESRSSLRSSMRPGI